MTQDQTFAELKTRTDVAQMFLVFMSLIGDVDKTALALDIDPAFVSWLADKEGWKEKVRRVSLMSKSEKPGDWERAQNRALNFVQAHRVRMLIDRLLVELINCKEEDFATRFRTYNKDGAEMGMSARFFSDVTAALSKVHELSYFALGDSVGERVKRTDENGNDRSVGDIHAALIQALNNPAVSQKSTQLIVEEASAAVSAQLSERKTLPERVVNEIAVECQSVPPEGDPQVCQDDTLNP